MAAHMGPHTHTNKRTAKHADIEHKCISSKLWEWAESNKRHIPHPSMLFGTDVKHFPEAAELTGATELQVTECKTFTQNVDKKKKKQDYFHWSFRLKFKKLRHNVY